MTPTVDIDAAKSRLKAAFVDFAGALAGRAFDQVLAEVTGRMMRSLADEANATLAEPARQAAFTVPPDMVATIAAPRRGRKPGRKAKRAAKVDINKLRFANADGGGQPDTGQDEAFKADWIGGVATKKLVKKYKRSPYKLRKWADRLGLEARPRGFSGIEARATAAAEAPRSAPPAAAPSTRLHRNGEDRPVPDSGVSRVLARRETLPALSDKPSPVTETLPAADEILDVSPATLVNFLKGRGLTIAPLGSSRWRLGTGTFARDVDRDGLLERANGVRREMGKPFFRYEQAGA